MATLWFNAFNRVNPDSAGQVLLLTEESDYWLGQYQLFLVPSAETTLIELQLQFIRSRGCKGVLKYTYIISDCD